MFMRQARFMYTLARSSLGAEVPVADHAAAGIWRFVRKGDWYDKPCWLHPAFIAALLPLTGVHESAGAACNALFSLGTIAIVFLVARRLYGAVAGGFAALALAVSTFWLIYSRSFLAEVDGVFFVVLSFFLTVSAVSGERRVAGWAFLAGAVAGIGVLCQYRLMLAGPVLVVAAWAVARSGQRMRAAVFLGLGFGCVLMAFEAMLMIAVAVLKPGIPFSGLVGALMEKYLPGARDMAKHSGLQPGNCTAFAYYLFRNHGFSATALCLLGIVPFFWSRESRPAMFGVVAFVVVTFVVLAMQIWIVARAVSLLIPFFCILAGQGFAVILGAAPGDAGRARRVLFQALALAAVLGVLVENIGADVRVVHNDTGYGRAADLLVRDAPPRIFADPESYGILGWHAPDLPYESIHSLHDKIGKEDLRGAYVMFDAVKFHMYPDSKARADALEKRVLERGTLLLEEPNLTTLWRQFLFEGTQAHDLSGVLASIDAANEDDITSIRVCRIDRAGPSPLQ